MGAVKQHMIAQLPNDADVALYNTADNIAQQFHEAYERLVPDYGYRICEASARPWADVPEQDKALMTAVVAELLLRDVIRESDERLRRAAA